MSPSPRHPRGRSRRQRAPSSVSLKPPLPAPLGPPPAPRRPFQTPWARGGCSVRKRWPRLGPGRRGCERGGGEAPGTVSRATRRGRARRDAGSSRSTAGARRRRWQREPRDRSITGSHGARAFSSLRAGASTRHTSSGRKGPAPEPLRRAVGRALGRRVQPSLVLFLSSRLFLTPLLPRPGGRGPQAAAAPFSAALVARRAGAATAADAVQRNEVGLVGVGKRGGGVGAEGGCRAGRGLWWLLLVLFFGSPGSTVSPSLSRHREGRDQRGAQEEEGRPPARGGGGGWGEGAGGGEGGKMASAHAPRRRRHKAGSGGAGGGGSSGLGERRVSRRKLPKAGRGAEAGSGGAGGDSGGGEFRQKERIRVGLRDSARWGWAGCAPAARPG
ncbi:spidroin-1-like [Gorilla gorilla gorilla]|uniref:spidroin-1-like n=1 Tax=Gorilla gorilla gorilla TaxID=9595 RepID=UPI00300808CA